jgi:SRSO17 transposase
MRQALADGVPAGVVLGDAAYGNERRCCRDRVVALEPWPG